MLFICAFIIPNSIYPTAIQSLRHDNRIWTTVFINKVIHNMM